jgi:hypothetical protein
VEALGVWILKVKISGVFFLMLKTTKLPDYQKNDQSLSNNQRVSPFISFEHDSHFKCLTVVNLVCNTCNLDDLLNFVGLNRFKFVLFFEVLDSIWSWSNSVSSALSRGGQGNQGAS